MPTNNNIQKYKSYTLDNLLQDNDFIRFVKYPDKENNEFWYSLLEKGIIKQQDFNTARFYVQSVQVESVSMEEDEIKELWENIEIENKANLKSHKNYLFLFSGLVAGILILLGLSLPYLLQNSEYSSFSSLSIEDIPVPDISGKEIQLVLADNSTMTFEETEIEISHTEEKISINQQEVKNKSTKKITNETSSYNQLLVPLGKRSTISLEDGTRIWLNAGSRIIYPVKFDDHYREILIEGEAFFEVAPEKRPFLVKSSSMQIEVVGTSFNISAYKEETEHAVVLVTGKVKVSNKNTDPVSLLPNQKYTTYEKNYRVEQINAEDYIAWKSGYYQLRNENIICILKWLSRYYGENIEYISEEKINCSGKLDLKENLDEVLQGVGLTAPIFYEKINNKYIVSNLKK